MRRHRKGLSSLPMRLRALIFSILVGVANSAALCVSANAQNSPPLYTETQDPVAEILAQLANAATVEEAEALEIAVVHLWSRSDSVTATLLYDRAMEAWETNDQELATNLMARVLDLQPEFAHAWHQTAAFAMFMDDFDGALAALEKALEFEPRHFPALAILAIILEEIGNKNGALIAVRRAKALNPFIENIDRWEARLEHDVLGRDI